MKDYTHFIIIFLLIVIVVLTCMHSAMSYKAVEHSEKFVPNFNYDSGVATTVRGQEWTQPQMYSNVGLGNKDAPRLMNMVYPKYKEEYLKNLYDYGNIFHIPTSTTNASDTTEDNLQAFVIERSRFNNPKEY